MTGGAIPMPPEVDVLATLQHEMWVRFSQRSEAAAGALWTYDVLINIDLELAHIWVSLDSRKRPFKVTKAIFNVLYLAQRYMPLLDSVFLDQYCGYP
ncbi:hypothetical protein PM082_022214 [Marasmius tenuissimus]|nr:hypothetical protein PM082_022214 [Marasmius tenuissimus]